MPPTRAAATMTTSGRLSRSHSCVSACRARSSTRRSAVSTSQRSDASRRTSAAPTIPRWPATKTRLPARSNGSVLAAALIIEPFSDVAGKRPSVMPVYALLFQPHLRAIAVNHFRNQIDKARLVAPAEPLARFARIAEQNIDLGRTEIARIDFDQNLSGLGIDPDLVDAGAAPDDPAAHMAERALDKFTDRMFLAGGQHIVVGFVLLEHHPHAFHIVAGVAPIALGIQITEIDSVLQAKLDGGDRAGDLARHEGLAAGRAFVIEQNAVGSVHPVGFAIVHRDPVGIELGGGVGRARIEGCSFTLRHLPDHAV